MAVSLIPIAGAANMMLRTLLPGLPQRYAFAGSAIGALLPIVGFSSEALSEGPNFRVFERLDDPVHALMLTVPALAGLASYWFGRNNADLTAKLKARERSERHLLKLSLQDRLTGLPNRRALEREIERFIALRAQGRFCPAFLLLDLDKFKHVNDTMGHDAGDELLTQFVERLQGSLGALARLFRLGGDEFVITLAGSPEDGDIERLCRMIKTKADEPFNLRAGSAITGVSIGISYLDPADTDMADILKRADLALYIAKDIPGSSHAFHTPALAAHMLGQMRIEQEMAAGLRNGEFFLEYQPIVDSARRGYHAFEALVRWRHPTRGVLTPDQFLPVAERSGHIMALGRFVVAQAIRDAAGWPEHIGVAVNVTGDEFRDPNFVRHIRDCLEANSLKPARLTIEITEAVFTADIGLVRACLVELRDIGVRIALDDFGIGFSSISHLREFPIDQLKVDRSFTVAMLDGGRETELIDIIMRLGRIFDVSATVEGVETQTQMDMAFTLGATAVQGYHISRPVSADTVQELIYSAGFEPLKPALRISA
jgi:diguanylate cyclase (GGDEF)-like protein